MSRRLIDANAIKYRKTNVCCGHGDYRPMLFVTDDDIAKTPTVDAVEVVHAHWKFDPNGCDWGIGAYRCSYCGNKNSALPINEDAYVYSYACSNYCPHCGAKMDGGNEDG